jgi:hypothetical protein
MRITDMKKIFVFALVLALLATVSSCSTTPKGGPTADGVFAGERVPEVESPAAKPAVSTDFYVSIAAVTASINAVFADPEPRCLGPLDEFDYYFLEKMEDMELISDIVGSEEMAKFYDEITEPRRWDAGRLVPTVYQAIEYFGISEERFREENDHRIESNRERGAADTTYTEDEIAALYCGDAEETARRLINPYAFRTGKKVVLNSYEALSMDAGELIKAGVNLDELSEYCARLRAEVPRHPQSDVEWYMKKIDKTEKTIEEARALAS